MRKIRLTAIAFTAALTLGAGAGIAGAATSGGSTGPTTTPSPVTVPASMDAMHDRMVAQLPAGQRAAFDQLHNQMTRTGSMPNTGVTSGNMGSANHISVSEMMTGQTR